MDIQLFEKLKNLKRRYEPDGFIILGVFGSHARGDATKESDIDILYEITEEFYSSYPGWMAVPVIEKIGIELRREFGKKIDLADKNALGEIGQKYIMSEVRYV